MIDREALKEMVADLVRFNRDPVAIADEAIALALEEAARIAASRARELSHSRDTHEAVQAAIAEEIAEEIMALIPSGNNPAGNGGADGK